MHPRWHLLYVLLNFVARVAFTSAQCTIGYTGPDPSLWCTCNAGYTGRNFIAPYSVTACGRFMALKLTVRSFVSVVNKNNAAVGTLPTYNPSGGPNGKGHVSFNRLASQIISGGAWNCNVLSNGGFTFVAVLRPTTSIVLNNVIFAGGNAADTDYIRVRVQGTSSIQFSFIHGGSTFASIVAAANSLKLNTWVTVVMMYYASNYNTQVYINGALSNLQNNGNQLRNQAMTYTYVANKPGATFWNGDMAGLFVVDELLSLSAATEVATSMSFGVDLTNTQCPSGPTCTECPAGSYKITANNDACTNCPASTTSPIGSTSSVACITASSCDAGYTGPDGGPCAACVAGKYKAATGSAACTNCGPGTYSSTLAATAAAACLACAAGTTSPAASTSSAACIFPPCNPGYTGPDGICSTCVAGTYKVGTGSAACMPCVAGTYSTIPAATAETACLACGGNSDAPIQSSTATACTCNAGYSGAHGGVCTPCAAGTYKVGTGSAACTSCPAFSGMACAPCTLSTLCVCTGYTGEACTACVSASAPASMSVSACVCGPGQYDASA